MKRVAAKGGKRARSGAWPRDPLIGAIMDVVGTSQGRPDRHRGGHLLAGVSGQVAGRLGVHVNLVRLAFVALVFAGGLGFIAYAAGLIVFRDPEDDLDLAPVPPPGRTDAGQAAALGAVVLGALLLARFLGLPFNDGLAWPTAAVAFGFGLIWLQAPRVRPGYIGAGALLVAGGVCALVVHLTSWATLRNGVVGAVALVALGAIAAAPWRTRRGATLGDALADVAADAEQEFGVRVEVCRRDDFDLAGLEPLVLAAREGIRNAARHSAAPRVSVIVQRNGSGPVVLVRDRGRGFDPRTTPARGLASAIVRPLAAAGGTAHVRSRPGLGCEVELALPAPRRAPSADTAR